MMPKLVLSGDWNSAGEMTLGLLQAGFQLEWTPVPRDEGQETTLQAGLQLSAVSSKVDFPVAGGRWLAWLRVDDSALTLAAYQAGAQAVFPPDMPPALLAQAILSFSGAPAHAEFSGTLRRVQRGDPIFLEPDSVLTIHEGVLATMMVHDDGAAVLLGLSGAGHILVTHPDDDCFIQVLAHTTAVVSILSWEQAVLQPGFSEKLRARLQHMEAWAAMQSRKYLDQRVLGILSLLAEQFGAPHPDGIVIDMRLTHAQLAAAVGSTRTTITRVLGELHATGKLRANGSGRAERFVLRTKVELAHH